MRGNTAWRSDTWTEHREEILDTLTTIRIRIGNQTFDATLLVIDLSLLFVHTVKRIVSLTFLSKRVN